MGDDSPYSKGGSAAWAKRRRRRTSRPSFSSYVVARVVYESVSFEEQPKTLKIREFAKANQRSRTSAERRFRYILENLNGGVLRGRFKDQHIISGKWIADFYFPEFRLVIEIDGPIHMTANQSARDRRKDLDCQRFDMTVLRFANEEIFGNRTALVEKLRSAWREAKSRKNLIIGTRRPV